MGPLFPGYYRSQDGDLERRTGAVPVGTKFGSDWYFREKDFEKLRAHIERKSEGRWRYSGGADLVLVNGMLVDDGEPTIDWVSTQVWASRTARRMGRR